MKILVISRNAWDDTNSVGNTLSNFFMGMDNVEFASIYFRSATPNNRICKRYYHVSETEILKKWFVPDKIGKPFSGIQNGFDYGNTAAKKEKAIIRVVQKHGLNLVYALSDYIWYSKKWINDKLKAFIESFSPDIMFCFVKSAPQYYLTVKYLRENFNIPLFTWIADDEYTGLLKNNSSREIKNLSYILNESTIVRGCSQEICDYYNLIFGCMATPLYKGCDFKSPLKESVNSPIRIVYAGNLLYGRLGIVRKIAEALDSYGNDAPKVSFEIYSNTFLSSDELDFFDRSSCSMYMGQKDYESIKKILAAADIVLHVESFDESEILKTRYSFSTKIIDCLQCGSILLAIGPKDIASIEYIRRIPGACVIDNMTSLCGELFSFLNDTSSFRARSKSIRNFARANHDATTNAQELQRAISSIIMEEA